MGDNPATMPRMRDYVILEAVAGSYTHNLLGSIDFAFDAGPVVPRSEQEEIVLEEQLIPAGFATASGAPRRQVSAGNIDGPEELEDGGAPPADRANAPTFYPTDGTVAEVLSWVGDDPARRLLALEAEENRDHPRKGILAELVTTQES